MKHRDVVKLRRIADEIIDYRLDGAADLRRRIARCSETLWDELLKNKAAPGSGQPESAILRDERKRAILAPLDVFCERERRIVEMRYFAGFQNIEIAEILQTTPSNIGVILHHTLTKLRHILGN